MTLQTERVRTVNQVGSVIERSEAVDVAGTNREAGYEFVRDALMRIDYGGTRSRTKGWPHAIRPYRR